MEGGTKILGSPMENRFFTISIYPVGHLELYCEDSSEGEDQILGSPLENRFFPRCKQTV